MLPSVADHPNPNAREEGCPRKLREKGTRWPIDRAQEQCYQEQEQDGKDKELADDFEAGPDHGAGELATRGGYWTLRTSTDLRLRRYANPVRLLKKSRYRSAVAKSLSCV